MSKEEFLMKKKTTPKANKQMNKVSFAAVATTPETNELKLISAQMSVH